MLTFLELYQTQLGFVFFKLYTDAGLVYPPPLDTNKAEAAAGVGAYSLQEARSAPVAPQPAKVDADVKKVTGKDVRQTIKTIASDALDTKDADVPRPMEEGLFTEQDEDFVAHPSARNPDETAGLSTLQSLSSQVTPSKKDIFAPYTFFLSRESPRPLFEFIIRAFGGRIGWPASSGGGSPVEEDDESITHVIIDRPVVERPNETDEQRALRLRRKYVQPQWVVDCVNAGQILLEEPYAQGKTLPPHLSPFGEAAGAYDPNAPLDIDMEDAGVESDEEESVEESDTAKPDDLADDPAALRNAELQAEAAGVDFNTFEKKVQKTLKKGETQRKVVAAEVNKEEEMNKMMMSNKKRKLYDKVKHSQKKQTDEVSVLSLRVLKEPAAHSVIVLQRERLEKKRRTLDRGKKA